MKKKFNKMLQVNNQDLEQTKGSCQNLMKDFSIISLQFFNNLERTQNGEELSMTSTCLGQSLDLTRRQMTYWVKSLAVKKSFEIISAKLGNSSIAQEFSLLIIESITINWRYQLSFLPLLQQTKPFGQLLSLRIPDALPPQSFVGYPSSFRISSFNIGRSQFLCFKTCLQDSTRVGISGITLSNAWQNLMYYARQP